MKKRVVKSALMNYCDKAQAENIPIHTFMNETLELAKSLIERRSITPNDTGCQTLISEKLTPLDFVEEHFDCEGVANLWLRRGNTKPLLVFAGHTDVVPIGDESAWQYPPFKPTEKNGLLYGRGAADMKSSVAAMTIACQRFAKTHPDHKGSLALLITSDEEGLALNGTRHVVEQLSKREEKIDWCVIGEPSAQNTLGDTIKHGRRGSLTGRLLIKGKQGHIAYPQNALNPIHAFAPALLKLCNETWDSGNNDFPPTTFQVAHIQAGVGADNVIPGLLEVHFNFRFSTESDDSSLRLRTEKILDTLKLDYQLDWHLSGQAFLTSPKSFLAKVVQQATTEVVGITPACSTAGGTSDGRFIAPLGIDVIEIGPVNESIHKVNEHIKIKDLEPLTQIYQRIIHLLLI